MRFSTTGPTSFIAACALACSFGLMVAFVSSNLHTRFVWRLEAVEQQQALLERKPFPMFGETYEFPEFRNRLLFPVLLDLATRTGFREPSEWYLVLRLMTAVAMFFTLIWLTRKGAWPWTLIGCGLLAHVCVLTFTEAWEFPMDFTDVIAMLVFCALAMARRWWALLAVALVAAANRESAAFAGVIWLCLWGWTAERGMAWREIARGLALGAAPYAVVTYLRFAFSAGDVVFQQGRGILDLPRLIAEFLAHPTPYHWPFLLPAAMAPILLVAYGLRSEFDGTERRLLSAAALVFGVSIVFGILDELRVLLTPLAIAIYPLVRAGQRAAASA